MDIYGLVSITLLHSLIYSFLTQVHSPEETEVYKKNQSLTHYERKNSHSDSQPS